MLGRKKGGLEQVGLDYAIAFQNNEHESIFISNENAYINKFIPENLKNFQIKVLGQWDILAKAKLNKIIKQERPDAIIAHGNKAIRLARKVAKKNNVKLVGVAHNDRLKGFEKLDYAIGLTNASIKRLKAKNIKYIQKVPNHLKIKNVKQAACNFNKPIKIVTLARLHPVKGLDILIESFNQMVEWNFDVELKIAGEGSEKENLENLIKKYNLQNKITLTGWIDNKKRDALLKESDIFISSSREEPFGIVFLEAMQFSLPIIAAKTEGSETIFTHKKNGYLCNLSSANLAKAIRHFIDNPKEAKKMGEAGNKLLKEKYDAKNLSAEILKIFD